MPDRDHQTTDKLAWLRENIDYRENAPGAFYPEIFSDERGSIRCDGLEWKAGDEMMHFTKPMEIGEIEDLAAHAWAVNCALSGGPMWKRRSEQLKRIRENKKKEPVLLEIGGEMHVSPVPDDELRPFSSLTLDQAHIVVKHLSDTLGEVYRERRMLWAEVAHWRDQAEDIQYELDDFRQRTSREVLVDAFHAMKTDCRHVWWKIRSRLGRRSPLDNQIPF